MALTFIPQLWAANLQKAIERKLVFGQEGVINKNFEGQIKKAGDTVHINQIGDVTIGDYTGALGAPQELTDSQKTLVIDQKKYFNFMVDSVEEAQNQGSGAIMQQAMRKASQGIKAEQDKFLAAAMTAGAGVSLYGGAVQTPTKSDAYEILVDGITQLAANDVDEENLFAIIPPFMHGLMLKDDRFTKDMDTLRNGYVGKAAGLDIYVSNNVVVNGLNNDEHNILFGHSMATTFAQQVLDVESIKNADFFGDQVRGLSVYGAKVIEPAALVSAKVKKA